MPTLQEKAANAYEQKADRMRQSYVAAREADGTWRKELVPAHVTGLPRDTYIYRAARKTDPLTFSWHGDKDTFCPPQWWDLAIGSGPCGFGCRACFLMLTFRAMRDPLLPIVYDNIDHIHRCVAKWLVSPKRKAKHSLGLGIDRSDSLLYEGITGHARQLIPWFADPERNPNGCYLILLTKSANVHYLEGLPATGAPVAVTFSVNPEPVADLWEGKYPDTLERITPQISERLRAAKEAQDMGFEVRLRLDPILTPDGWEEYYKEFIAEIARLKLRPSRITLGTYREKNSQLDAWRDKWGLPPMEWEPPLLSKEGTHRRVLRRERVLAYAEIAACLRKALPQSAISLCKETNVSRRETGLCGSCCNCLSAPETVAYLAIGGKRL